ncbi:hypothetical protein J7E99_37050 [Streptomyces sp. ISL-44]|uniref:hypothetical protein n=1 Tax=Streptomyces sp. ISL-44 TaxID=2819184 RepID=UPI001BE875C3|nr:hypothetical protein [Streptomyces sp. ISL-44]MBT2546125.1 hypothetical protein [Streptomyces sp. ISL-44]
MVDDGVAGFAYSEGGWNFREEQLGQFVRWVLHGQLVSAESYPRYRRVYRVIDDKRVTFRRSLWWTSRQSVDAQTRHELMRQRQEAAREEREARETERKEAEKQRQQELEEQERARRAEEAERLRKEREERERIAWEERQRRWAETDARHAREKAEEEERLARKKAEQEERERQALETANAWWRRLSKSQSEELFAAVVERAWREEKLWVEVPETPRMSREYAYGVPLYTRGKRNSRTPYGIVRPCPGLLSVSPQMAAEHALVRSTQEARELQQAGHKGRITDFDLPGHEQLTMC